MTFQTSFRINPPLEALVERLQRAAISRTGCQHRPQGRDAVLPARAVDGQRLRLARRHVRRHLDVEVIARLIQVHTIAVRRPVVQLGEGVRGVDGQGVRWAADGAQVAEGAHDVADQVWGDAAQHGPAVGEARHRHGRRRGSGRGERRGWGGAVAGGGLDGVAAVARRRAGDGGGEEWNRGAAAVAI